MDSALLAIESSCDETSAAVIRNGKVLNNIIASQSVHIEYGGVVPELASRAHQQVIVRVVDEALHNAHIGKHELNAVAYTNGPGLMGALLVGASFSKGLALALGIPLIAVNHLHAHALSHHLASPAPRFPYLCLTVSGGHTQLVVVRGYLDLEVIGETQDDAVGEAFDKAAKMLGLPYPGGPMIDRLARQGNPKAFTFPDAETSPLDFSFSGIKTSFLYFLRDQTKNDPDFLSARVNDLCASLQFQLVQMLMKRLTKASMETGISEIAIAGGVAANTMLRETLRGIASEKGWNFFIPEMQYCTDNAAMIAQVGYHKFLAGDFSSPRLAPDPDEELLHRPNR